MVESNNAAPGATVRRPGARPKRLPGKAAVPNAAMEAAIKGVLDDLTPEQLAKIGPREGLLRVMRWALRAGALPLFIDLATALMPYMHAKKTPLTERRPNAPTAEEIAADTDPLVAD